MESRNVKVIDEHGQALPFVNVVLMSLPDSTFIQGAVTDEQGEFHLACKLEKAGVLKVSCIGYETQYISLPSDREGLVIQLKEDAQLLGEVTIKAQLPKVQLTGEGLQTNIKGSVLENAGTAKDVHQLLYHLRPLS